MASDDDSREEYQYLVPPRTPPPVTGRASATLYTSSHDYHEQFYKGARPKSPKVIKLPGPQQFLKSYHSFQWRVAVGILSVLLLSGAICWIAVSIYELLLTDNSSFRLHCLFTLIKSCLVIIISTHGIITSFFTRVISVLVFVATLTTIACLDIVLLVYCAIIKYHEKTPDWKTITNLSLYSAELLLLVCCISIAARTTVAIKKELNPQ
jgi:hypothetical protein